MLPACALHLVFQALRPHSVRAEAESGAPAQMNLVYYDLYPNKGLEEYLAEYSALQQSYGEPAITVTRAATVEDVLRESDVCHPLRTRTPPYTNPSIGTLDMYINQLTPALPPTRMSK